MGIFTLIIAMLVERWFHDDIADWRSFRWLQTLHEVLTTAITEQPEKPDNAIVQMLPTALTLLLPILTLMLLISLVSLLLGGWILIPASLLMLLYCLGPADLQSLYSKLLVSEQAQQQRVLQTLQKSPMTTSAQATSNALDTVVAAMFISALRGWFTIIVWFGTMAVIAGVPTAMLLVALYRLTERLLAPDLLLAAVDDNPHQHWLQRLCWLLEWPAARLMIGLLAIAADFDLVEDAWREHGSAADRRSLEHHLLLAIASRQLQRSAQISTNGDHTGQVQSIATAGYRLLQRMLILLAGLLALLALLAWVM